MYLSKIVAPYTQLGTYRYLTFIRSVALFLNVVYLKIKQPHVLYQLSRRQTNRGKLIKKKKTDLI